mmetsp:Transcript_143819/g.459559  ORF Transcript_143819/g.459559 Transcript_143819/m.459559 type:complete len:212 (+) Transcript_143819:2312-2947(+)
MVDCLLPFLQPRPIKDDLSQLRWDDGELVVDGGARICALLVIVTGQISTDDLAIHVLQVPHPPQSSVHAGRRQSPRQTDLGEHHVGPRPEVKFIREAPSKGCLLGFDVAPLHSLELIGGTTGVQELHGHRGGVLAQNRWVDDPLERGQVGARPGAEVEVGLPRVRQQVPQQMLEGCPQHRLALAICDVEPDDHYSDPRATLTTVVSCRRAR